MRVQAVGRCRCLNNHDSGQQQGVPIVALCIIETGFYSLKIPMYQAKNMGIDVEQLVLNSRHNNPKHIHPTRLPCESYATWSPKSEVAGCAVCTTELRPSSLVPCPVDLLFHSPHGQTTCGTDRAMDRYHAMVCQREG